MRLLKLLFLILSTVLIVGCVNEADQQSRLQDNLQEVVFHAGWEPETKTVLQENGSVWWSPGDEISLFVGNLTENGMVGSGSNGGYRLKATNSCPSASVDFVGQIDNDNSGNRFYYALYPYDSNASFKDGDVYTSIPPIQYAKAGTVSDKQLVSLAVSKNARLSFMNLCGGIKFSVANSGITKVVFKDHPSEAFDAINAPIAGNVKVKDNNCEPLYDGSESMSVTVLPSNGDCFEPGQYYYVTMIPKSFRDLEVLYYKGDMMATYRLTYEVSQETHRMPGVDRAVFKRVYDKDADLVFSKAYSTYAAFGTDAVSGLYKLLPDGVDKTLITEAIFHTSTDKTTDILLAPANDSEGYAPIFFELNGTVAHYYTPAERYQIREASWLFGGWSSLKKLDLSVFSTESVTNMAYMFADCVNLETLDVSGFNTGNVEEMGGYVPELQALEIIGHQRFFFKPAH